MKRALISVLVMTLVAIAGLASPASADRGNSENAHLCQKGGWEDLRGEDGTRFANQGECVSHGAQGGTLVALDPRIEVSFTPTSDPEFCLVHVGLADLDPSTEYTVDNRVSGTVSGFPFDALVGTTTIETDASGNAMYVAYSFLESGVAGPRFARHETGSLSSPTEEILCS